jgi:hypothetical protein
MIMYTEGWSRWACSLRRRTAARLLGSPFRLPPDCMDVCFLCLLCVLQTAPSGTSWSLIQRSPSVCACVCMSVCLCLNVFDLETSTSRPRPDLGCGATHTHTHTHTICVPKSMSLCSIAHTSISLSLRLQMSLRQISVQMLVSKQLGYVYCTYTLCFQQPPLLSRRCI